MVGQPQPCSSPWAQLCSALGADGSGSRFPIAQPPSPSSAPGVTAGSHVALRWAGSENDLGRKVTI